MLHMETLSRGSTQIEDAPVDGPIPENSSVEYPILTRPNRVYFDSKFLGATKQLPYLLSSLRILMPSANIDVELGDFHGGGNGEVAFLNDLSRVDPNLKANVTLKPPAADVCAWFRERSIGCHVRFSPYECSSFPAQSVLSSYASYDWSPEAHIPEIKFWVDPLKYEQRPLLSDAERQSLREKYNIGNARVVVAGSIGPEEYRVFVDAVVQGARNRHTDGRKTVLLLVPRASSMVESLHVALKKRPFESFSDNAYHFHPSGSKALRRAAAVDAVIITECGVLQDIYSIADVAYIGNTFHPDSQGQNPLEPAFYGTPLVSGHHWMNNDAAFKGLKNSGLLRTVGTVDDLAAALYERHNPASIAKNAARAHEFIVSKQGAAKEYASIIKNLVQVGTPYVDNATPSGAWLS